MNPLDYGQVIQGLGSLELVHVKSPVQFPCGYTLSSGIYWRDAKNPAGFGPFEGAYDAFKHYEDLAKSLKLADIITLPLQPNVINVDFKLKLRLK